MPLPLLLGAAAAVAGIAGVGSGIRGGLKMKEANETMQLADACHKENVARFEKQSIKTSEYMDKVGQEELKILNSFDTFIQVFEKIHNKPQFKKFNKDGIELPQYNAEELEKVSVGAGLLLGGIGGAAVGTAGGFAAAGATTAAVMALGTASTGTAIASLSGVAATNAALAALGGGAIAAGGGGMALGSAVLGGATLGVGLLVGGIIFNITGSSLSNKADEAWGQMKKAKGEIDKICIYLVELFNSAKKFYSTLIKANRIYREHFEKLRTIVEVEGKTEWNMFTSEEKIMTQNTALLVGVLFNMCKVKLVVVAENETDSNKVNAVEIEKSIAETNKVLLNMN
ncbi:hypothetical protein LKM01_24355 [Bacillus pacificus]|uniref:hypothetical protein n=1 Tax=Bacillus cereus group TaxID=86661 RepID=UPI0009367BFE|nr:MULTISPECIES: hypothetical protein [Bacillus cereus group]ASI76027.1 hypothetical protein BA202_01575 [Bacillus cereus]MCC2472475.1 hypothetical protein [Bacillus pacificus]MCC2484930.1 hypothetical protein [Bacillus pacificus]MDA1609529.1 hypothetical protein [Bacillus cereus group sp. TH208-1LC]MED1650968.1 hypothetical protein [Bacillus pacificus]